MDDVDENAHLVNALQRYATVVVQKSIVEGFGLTVAEPMWKARPVLASRVGGIQDQIVHGESGLLLDDPTDLDDFADRLLGVIRDEDLAARLGRAAHERATDSSATGTSSSTPSCSRPSTTTEERRAAPPGAGAIAAPASGARSWCAYAWPAPQVSPA